jgi:hypothetical protein
MSLRTILYAWVVHKLWIDSVLSQQWPKLNHHLQTEPMQRRCSQHATSCVATLSLHAILQPLVLGMHMPKAACLSVTGQYLMVCHVDHSQLVQETLPVSSLRLHLDQQAIYDPDQVCDSLLHLHGNSTAEAVAVTCVASGCWNQLPGC